MSRSINPWEFVFVHDRGLLERLSRCKLHGAAFLAHAALGIVVCGDTQASDVWVADCSIASILIQMVGQSLGLGSCWIQVRNRTHDEYISASQYIREVLDVPANFEVESIVALGYPAEQREPLSSGLLKTRKCT